MADTPQEPRRITDLDTLKAFGHPLRMRLYRALYIARTATASQLADQVDEAVSLVSYHLRKLADHGLIEPAETQSGDARERWWQVASQSLTYRDEDFSDAPERAATHAAVSRLSFDQHSEMYRGYLDAQSVWPAEWRSAAFSSEYLPRFTAGELAALSREMDELIQKHSDSARAAERAGETDGRENVALHLYGFPFRN
ncbi:helix-turn-helix domain-containing protein [Streptomyces sp. NBC_01267]|uniref:winged helix-turn-helix domain-containing protein n=1 Tax=unclassified Streptomyces TaxID=2593676 RepID=UPI002023D43F|nr:MULTISPECIES: helix-turn-helix domain-containing protein [unclassified Streptomyces]MCX4551682.1 helix-turn-helix domain-containing protein [Streptomyces sp. NBC_01500]WSC23059.1 helix-turn-helix domain-containing protein [Streptomyces sp. NBC_01766]